LFLSACGIGANWVASRFWDETKAWVERIGGTFMISAAVLLGLKTVSDRYKGQQAEDQPAKSI